MNFIFIEFSGGHITLYISWNNWIVRSISQADSNQTL